MGDDTIAKHLTSLRRVRNTRLQRKETEYKLRRRLFEDAQNAYIENENHLSQLKNRVALDKQAIERKKLGTHIDTQSLQNWREYESQLDELICTTAKNMQQEKARLYELRSTMNQAQKAYQHMVKSIEKIDILQDELQGKNTI